MRQVSIVVTAFLLTLLQHSMTSLLKTTFSNDTRSISQATIGLVEACSSKASSTVVIVAYENVYEQTTKKLSKTATLTFIRYSRSNDTESAFKIPFANYIEDFQLRWNAGIFLIAADSSSSLHMLLEKLRNTAWWNTSGFFVTVEEKLKRGGCDKAYGFLRTLWEYDVLSSLFACLDDTGRAMMYTFNPYKSFAPKPWREVATYVGRDKHPWFLFEREYTHGKITCNNIKFDRTRNLNGYPVRVNACPFEPFVYINQNKTDLDKYSGLDGDIIISLLNVLNATLANKTYEKCFFGIRDRNGLYQGMLTDVFLKNVDIGANQRYLRLHQGLDVTYPHYMSSMCLASRLNSEKPSWIKLETLLLRPLNLGLIGVFFDSLIVLRYLERRSYSWTFLNSLQMIISMSTAQSPKTNSGRLITCFEFLTLLVIHTVFAGRLISQFTKQPDPINVNNIRDLKAPEYSIYTLEIIGKLFEDPIFHGRVYYQQEMLPCIMKLINDSESAQGIVCVDDCSHAKAKAMQSGGKIYVAPKSISSYFSVYMTVLDWPLLERVNILIQRLVEAGFPNHWWNNSLRSINRTHWHEMQKKKATSRFRSISFGHLSWIFYLLILSLLFSTVVFILEVTTTMSRENRGKLKITRRKRNIN